MLSDALKLIPVLPERTPISVETLDYFRRHEVPQSLVDDLRMCVFAGWIGVGPLGLVPLNELESQTYGVRECIENGFLVLAGCPNFDPVAVEVRSGEMVFVSHDLLWDHHDRFEDCIHRAPFRYSEFWKQAVLDPRFPIDFFDAQKRWIP